MTFTHSCHALQVLPACWVLLSIVCVCGCGSCVPARHGICCGLLKLWGWQCWCRSVHSSSHGVLANASPKTLIGVKNMASSSCKWCLRPDFWLVWLDYRVVGVLQMCFAAVAVQGGIVWTDSSEGQHALPCMCGASLLCCYATNTSWPLHCCV